MKAVKRNKTTIGKDQSKLRLQLFYLDELVQIASESLRLLEPVEEGDEKARRAKNGRSSPRKVEEIQKSPVVTSNDCSDDALLNTQLSQFEMGADYGLSYILDQQSPELTAFDFGRDRDSLKRQRVFFRERLSSNNMHAGGRESLLAMKKQGSFIFREYKVPNRSEIQEAINHSKSKF